MKRRLFAFLFLLSASSAAPAFESVPLRIASMNLTADEILVEIVPVERLVAATAAADDAGTSNIVGRVPPGVARFRRAEMERLLALRVEVAEPLVVAVVAERTPQAGELPFRCAQTAAQEARGAEPRDVC